MGNLRHVTYMILDYKKYYLVPTFMKNHISNLIIIISGKTAHPIFIMYHII